MREGFESIRALGAQVFGVSFDSPETLISYKKKNDLPFELLSDAKKDLARTVGAVGMMGMVAKRSTVFVSPESKIAHLIPDATPLNHDREICGVLETLGLGSKEG